MPGRREGLIYYDEDEYADGTHIDIHKTIWRKKKDYMNDELSAEEYLQRAKAKLEKREQELKKGINKVCRGNKKASRGIISQRIF